MPMVIVNRKHFMYNNMTDILLISVANFTINSLIKILKSKLYITNYPYGILHGRGTIVIREIK